jgi:hypothetical protein
MGDLNWPTSRFFGQMVHNGVNRGMIRVPQSSQKRLMNGTARMARLTSTRDAPSLIDLHQRGWDCSLSLKVYSGGSLKGHHRH